MIHKGAENKTHAYILYVSINLAYEYRPVFENAKALLDV